MLASRQSLMFSIILHGSKRFQVPQQGYPLSWKTFEKVREIKPNGLLWKAAQFKRQKRWGWLHENRAVLPRRASLAGCEGSHLVTEISCGDYIVRTDG